MAMKNWLSNDSGTIVMIFSGEYDLESKDLLRTVVDELAKAPNVVLDFSAVTYIDATVIAALMRLHNARAADGLERETLVVRHKNLLRVLDVLHLTEVFNIVEALDDALSKNGKTAIIQYASSFAGSKTAQGDGSRADWVKGTNT